MCRDFNTIAQGYSKPNFQLKATCHEFEIAKLK